MPDVLLIYEILTMICNIALFVILFWRAFFFLNTPLFHMEKKSVISSFTEGTSQIVFTNHLVNIWNAFSSYW